MRLAHRLIVGALIIVSVFLIVAAVLSTRRLGAQLTQLTAGQLTREARFIAQ